MKLNHVGHISHFAKNKSSGVSCHLSQRTPLTYSFKVKLSYRFRCNAVVPYVVCLSQSQSAGSCQTGTGMDSREPPAIPLSSSGPDSLCQRWQTMFDMIREVHALHEMHHMQSLSISEPRGLGFSDEPVNASDYIMSGVSGARGYHNCDISRKTEFQT